MSLATASFSPVGYADVVVFFFFQAEDGIRDHCVTGVQTSALPISLSQVRSGLGIRPVPCIGSTADPGDWSARPSRSDSECATCRERVEFFGVRLDWVRHFAVDRKSVV